MRKRLGWALAFGGWMALWVGPGAFAGTTASQDWKVFGPGFVGTFADKDGSTIGIGPTEGPKTGEKGLSIQAHITGWVGMWATFNGDLSGDGAVRFLAKAPEPELVEIGLVDAKSIQYIAVFRVTSPGWKEFVIPLSRFRKGAYQMPQAPKDQPFDWSRIMSLQFLPQTHGDVDLQIGPVAFVKGKAKSRTGSREEGGQVTVQDFFFLDKTAAGPFTEGKGLSSIDLSLEKDPEHGDDRLASFHYTLKKDGWCGFWMRAGDAWGGQDWTGAKSLSLEVYSTEPIRFWIGFNDGNQNAFTAQAEDTRGKGWEKLVVPFREFHLNPYYQPPEAKKGSPQDLSHVETLNLAPQTPGVHAYKVRRIVIEK